MASSTYTTPELRRFGAMRDITKVGFSGAGDGCTIVGPGITGNGSNYDPICGNARS